MLDLGNDTDWQFIIRVYRQMQKNPDVQLARLRRVEHRQVESFPRADDITNSGIPWPIGSQLWLDDLTTIRNQPILDR